MKKKLPARWLLLVPAVFGAFAMAAVACGGDSEAGSDEDYVKAVCQAGSRLEERSADLEAELEQIMADADSETEGLAEVLELTAPLISDFANDLEKANPPADVEEFHEQLVDAFKSIARLTEDGDVEAYLEQSEDAFANFEPPRAIQDRLNAVAANISECGDSDFFD